MYGAACIDMDGFNHDKNATEGSKPNRKVQEDMCKSACDSIATIDQETACILSFRHRKC